MGSLAPSRMLLVFIVLPVLFVVVGCQQASNTSPQSLSSTQQPGAPHPTEASPEKGGLRRSPSAKVDTVHRPPSLGKSGQATRHQMITDFIQLRNGLQYNLSVEDRTLAPERRTIEQQLPNVTAQSVTPTQEVKAAQAGDDDQFEAAQWSPTPAKSVIVPPGEKPAPVTQTSSVIGEVPVYNAVFSPTAAGAVDHLLDGHATVLRFFIGPHASQSTIAGSAENVDPTMIESTKDVQVTITMACHFCEGNGDTSSVQVKRIVYHSKERSSSTAKFHIIPRAALVTKEPGSNEILLEIRNSETATIYNKILLTMTVDSADVTRNQSNNTVIASNRSFSLDVTDNREFKPDVIMTVLPQNDQPIQLSFDAINPELVKQLKGLGNKRTSILDILTLGGSRDPGGPQPRSFATADFTDKELNDLEASAKSTLKGITDRENAGFQNALAASLDSPVALDTTDFVTLGPSDKQRILDSIVPLGQYVFLHLFNGDAKKLIQIVESFRPADGHALRILIKTKGRGPTFPWQLLNDPDSKGEDSFWGLKYELAVESLDVIAPGNVLKKLQFNGDSASLFGVYAGPDYPVAYCAKQQSDYFSKRMQLKQSLRADSATEFKQKLKDNRSLLDFILVYTHGSDGFLNTVIDGNNVSVPLDPPGQRLIFSQDKDAIYVKPLDLRMLTNGTDTQAGPFFDRGPIVLLNACETGVLSSDRLTLPEAFISLGARGVIATVAPVPNKFALQFGDAIIDQRAQGSDTAAALHNVTATYWKDGNPLGLIYSDYSYEGVAEPKGKP